MLLKKLVAVVSAVVVIAVPYVKVLADDTVITLDETAKKFVVIDKNLEYRDMLPGRREVQLLRYPTVQQRIWNSILMERFLITLQIKELEIRRQYMELSFIKTQIQSLFIMNL